MNSPLVWYGGKGMMAQHIIRWFPPHQTFVDVFGGGASILLAKPPSPVDVYNDIDSGLVNFWRVLRDPEQFADLERRCHMTPYSREEYEHCRASWDACSDPIERAWAFYVAARMAYSGIVGGSWSHAAACSRDGKSKNVSAWLGALDGLPDIHARLRDVQVEHGDWSAVVDAYDALDTLFYCDPPYVQGTRIAPNVYQHEMDSAAHTALVERLLSVQGMVVLSGYANSAYAELEACGWTRHDFEVASFAGNARVNGPARSNRTESIWLNPAAIAARGRSLHPLFAEVSDA